MLSYLSDRYIKFYYNANNIANLILNFPHSVSYSQIPHKNDYKFLQKSSHGLSVVCAFLCHHHSFYVRTTVGTFLNFLSFSTVFFLFNRFWWNFLLQINWKDVKMFAKSIFMHLCIYFMQNYTFLHRILSDFYEMTNFL